MYLILLPVKQEKFDQARIKEGNMTACCTFTQRSVSALGCLVSAELYELQLHFPHQTVESF